MDYEVLKPFNTVNRRFAPGAGLGSTVNETVDVAPHTLGGLISRRFIQAKSELAVATKPASAPVAQQPAKTVAPRAPDEK